MLCLKSLSWFQCFENAARDDVDEFEHAHATTALVVMSCMSGSLRKSRGDAEDGEGERDRDRDRDRERSPPPVLGRSVLW